MLFIAHSVPSKNNLKMYVVTMSETSSCTSRQPHILEGTHWIMNDIPVPYSNLTVNEDTCTFPGSYFYSGAPHCIIFVEMTGLSLSSASA